MNKYPCNVVEIQMEPHPNADSLSLVRVGGFTVCVNTSCWQNGQLAVYIPPESIVQTDMPEFAFLKVEGKTEALIKVRKLRGIYSQGCLVQAPEGCRLGEDCADILGVKHYEPPEFNTTFGNEMRGPQYPKYDIDNFRKYHKAFQGVGTVNVTEKLHGANFRATYHGDQVLVGGRNIWVKLEPPTVYSKAYIDLPQIDVFCKENQDYILYGEVYGQVKHFEYDSVNRHPKFRAFDIRTKSAGYIDNILFRELCDKYSIPTVPQLGDVEFNLELLEEMSTGSTTIGKSPCREGIVIKPLKEVYSPELDGRLILKLVNNDYLALK